ncbi:MAG TPA: sugar ABC transporter substrate-binding protein [Candidatus Baltobacteraceae bacterium]|jgi:sorbitol/mannitol transport system substrate-binding protein|nr:sugar ABC transporter substrate-binding protein [Candidatus Baltobacteraceae bacterium]
MRHNLSKLSGLAVACVIAISAGEYRSSPSVAAMSPSATLTIVTVNNPQMIDMEKLTPEFTKETGIAVNYVTLPENTLREKVTNDVATGGGQFDLATVGTYEVPIWAKNGWLDNLDDKFAQLPPGDAQKYDLDDVLPSVRKGLSYQGHLYALPFYGESSMTYYNKALFKEAGLSMPEHPTWAQIASFADKLTDKSKRRYGIVLRGLPGWGEMGAPLTTVINTFGGDWFDMNWEPQLESPATKKAIAFYLDLLRRDGPPGSESAGYTECETLFAQGSAAIWVDATAAAGAVSDPRTSKVSSDIGFAYSPVAVTPKGSHWLWAWSLAMEASSKHKAESMRFLTWATSKEYIDLVARERGWNNVPPGTRLSTYQNPHYKALPYSAIVLSSVQSADPSNATLNKVPYVGVQYVGIPEFQGIGTRTTQDLAGVLTGQTSLDEALQTAQVRTERTMREAGYLK